MVDLSVAVELSESIRPAPEHVHQVTDGCGSVEVTPRRWGTSEAEHQHSVILIFFTCDVIQVN